MPLVLALTHKELSSISKLCLCVISLHRLMDVRCKLFLQRIHSRKQTHIHLKSPPFVLSSQRNNKSNSFKSSYKSKYRIHTRAKILFFFFIKSYISTDHDLHIVWIVKLVSFGVVVIADEDELLTFVI